MLKSYILRRMIFNLIHVKNTYQMESGRSIFFHNKVRFILGRNPITTRNQT